MRKIEKLLEIEQSAFRHSVENLEDYIRLNNTVWIRMLALESNCSSEISERGGNPALIYDASESDSCTN